MSSNPHTVRVRLPGCAYDVLIAAGLLLHAGELLRTISPGRKTAVVTNETLANLHLPTLRGALYAAGFEPIVSVIPDGEHFKSLTTLGRVFDDILPARIDRRTPLVALGGGVVGDIAGFAASAMLRGLPLVQLPTSLLAMVDASVGGKTGINHASGKNLIGAFHQPSLVLIDPDTLRTLPPAELHNGLAECIKHELIADAEGFARLEASIDRALSGDVEYLAQLVAHNVAIKAGVVEQDPTEQHRRAVLNLGHTFGHAIETVRGYTLGHGQCVALGLCCAAYAAVRLGTLDPSDRRRIVDLIARAQLPTGGIDLDTDAVCDAMLGDKKVTDGKIRFVIPCGIGRVELRDDLPGSLVRECIESIRG